MTPNPEHLPKPPVHRTARDLMTPVAHGIGEDETVLRAAQQMIELGVGALPICAGDGRVRGMLTDRDIVAALAGGKNLDTTLAGQLAQGEVVTIGADDDTNRILRTMTAHKVRRLPVIDGRRLIGIVALADVARVLPHSQVGRLLDALSRD
ncbi:CBS domain-containing protein [Streptomyces sp. H10-C2]|uniref:CBS domain-containing protein n=1 Tax=unclassified Streptomyces TaxID=2593676 RepID=UPI0024B91573|nr:MULTISPECIES: CBS domain-containing protein [unclassified Streptomyces]MDJ0347041.1 CBS domain-containing protein [Streptomyces sp. PH10-H1]MDJ0375309.1 CBS domain-containing protein [Streptomyces sp. H10-C2]